MKDLFSKIFGLGKYADYANKTPFKKLTSNEKNVAGNYTILGVCIGIAIGFIIGSMV